MIFERGVLCTRDLDLARQGGRAVDYVGLHPAHPMNQSMLVRPPQQKGGPGEGAAFLDEPGSYAVLVLPRARPPLRPAAARAVDFLRVLVLRPVDFRPVVLRAVARPPLRPAATTDGALRAEVFLRPVLLRPVLLRAVDFLRVPVDFRVDLRVVDFLPVVLRAVARPPLRPTAARDEEVVFLRPVLLRAVDFLRVDLRVVDFLRPDVLRAVALPPFRPAATTDGARRVVFLRPVDFLRAVLLRPVDFFRPVDFRVPVLLLAVLLRLVVFFRVPVDLRVDEPPEDVFRAVVFLRAVVLRVLRTGLRVERPESPPNTSEVVPVPPVSMIRVVGVAAGSEPDPTPPPTATPPSSSRVRSIDPLSSAIAPLSVEFLSSYSNALPFIATNKQSFNATFDD